MRTDVHRPSIINPQDYDFVAYGYTGQDSDIESVRSWRKTLEDHMTRTGGTWSNHDHGGNCHVCGAHCVYTVIFYHRPTNSYIRTGFDCADNMDCGDPDAFKKSVKLGIMAKAGLKKAEEYLKSKDLAMCWTIYNTARSTPNFDYKREESKIIDIVSRLVKYGSLFPNQEEYLPKLLDGIINRGIRDLERQQKWDAAKKAPEGRVTVKGKIVSTRCDDTPFGKVIKMMVDTTDGWKAWGTMPGSLAADKGDQIEFTATFKRSDKDEKFAFFSRPSKAKVITA